MRDLGLRERTVFGIVVLAAVVMGVAPQPIIERTTASVRLLTAGYRDRLAEAIRNPKGLARQVKLGPGSVTAQAEKAKHSR